MIWDFITHPFQLTTIPIFASFVFIDYKFFYSFSIMIKIQTFIFSPFSENTFLLYDETGECVIIDAGCYEPYEKKELQDFVLREKLKPVRLLNTHCHIDHIFGNKFVSETFGIEVEAHKEELFNLSNAGQVSKMYGIRGFEPSPSPTRFLDGGSEIIFGKSKMDVLFVPGHAPGHLAFVNREQKFVICGDVLFYGSIGRTDFPGCSHEGLISSIKDQLFPLGDDFRVLSGHGEETTIGFERKNNPFLQ